MLVARRDPILDHGAQNRPLTQSRLTRAVSLLQMAGTVLGIPVALASGYSVYHSNFSNEAVCQSLRGNIIAMLDKRADASTLRMLVGRDVTAFEQNCATVDPDAVAAFRTLLIAKMQPPAAAKAVAPQPHQADVKNAVREPEHRAEPAKPPAVKRAAIESEPVRRDADVSDATWLAAVRGALVTHDQIRPAPAAPAKTAVIAPPAPPPAAHDPAPAEASSAPLPLAPPLPPAASVASVPAPKAEFHHPVPPAAIPDPVPPAEVAERAEPRSRWRALIAHIPGFNRVMDPD